jgi:hypothetical protein
MITTAKIKEHIAAVEAAMCKAGKREISKLAGIRDSLIKAVAILQYAPDEVVLERQHAANVKKLSNYHAAKRNIPHDFYRKKNLADLDQQYAPLNLKKSLEFLNYILEKNDDLLCGVLSSVSAPA